ncbi:MAG: bacillithiol transferase BstA [Saprospiraceae bacterium]|nr:bacillithiol transferase BstA [Saprospiraceae bacterium]
MTTTDLLRYPVGHYRPPEVISDQEISRWIETLAAFPARLHGLVSPLNDAQLDTPYRPGGWTVRQLVHHVADSHVNSYVRFKWAMTEDNPTIKTYDQDFWAAETDSKTAPVAFSLDLLAALHRRWVFYLRSFAPGAFGRTFYHPEMERNIRLDWLLGMYAWHCDHHYAHAAALIEREGW